jgi:hypothetical protein
MNYQAVVRDAKGEPLTAGGTVNIRFRIHKDSADGEILFEEMDAGTTNQFGLVTLAQIFLTLSTKSPP